MPNIHLGTPSRLLTATVLALSLASPVAAQSRDESIDAFVEGNVLGIFYHEMGHALIHIEEIPIFGQEEDAADVFSVVLTEALWEPDYALQLAYDHALGFDAEAQDRADDGDDVAWWDVHGPDEQRFYNTVCLYYGADPDNRTTYADDMGLPAERAEYCPEEFDQAWEAWGGVLDTVMDRGPGGSLRYEGPSDGLAGTVLSDEVAALNDMLTLSDSLTVRLTACGEANAFYDPVDRTVTFCTEFEDHLRAQGEAIIE
ncbi:hypothetical protein JANAI62_35210 [Jannaschia pagri]|uniref:Metallopeptidase n=1 Tax=Jannaschia pagri TaxID=2829797 RepID=A0ABQ4NR63_9RHOB|nr:MULTISPECIES: DUF4344 domain-containing metallopeptidase [unclassified Jannaschia]GIT93063.1 hypothetical protein JANAI61_35210 [Jannaschia sp. AI_61]GIT96898.1 hypothetical protein JANAI62_35210 [Jannaschia sp. AI_62]